MAGETKKRAVSPINGQPLPRGRTFTSETAREAARKANANRAARKSITEALRKRITTESFPTSDGRVLTGAEVIAESIIKGAAGGNAKMVEIALALMGETPKMSDKEILDAVTVVIDV